MLPHRLRLSNWFCGSGITASMARARRYSRVARDEYALSHSTASGRVRGRPFLARSTCRFSNRGSSIGESPSCPPCTLSRAAAQHRQPVDGSSWIAHRESVLPHDQVVPSANSCISMYPFFRLLMFVACRCARVMVESTETDQSIIPAASACVVKIPRTRSQVPSPAILPCHFQTVCHGPNASGTSRHWMPHR